MLLPCDHVASSDGPRTSHGIEQFRLRHRRGGCIAAAANQTRPSFSNVAWCVVRGTFMLPVGVNVCAETAIDEAHTINSGKRIVRARFMFSTFQQAEALRRERRRLCGRVRES